MWCKQEENHINMDKNKIQEKTRNVAKFTYEVIDDIFGKRILIFAYILAAIFAASVIFQVFTKYIYEEGFSTADALVATIVHTFSKIWVGILYGVLPAFGVFVVLYVVAKCIRNKNLRRKAEEEKIKAEKEGINVSGILFVFDELVNHNIISPKDATAHLESLYESNVRLPKEEVEKRLEQWK